MDLALQVSKCQECALRKNSKPIPGEGPVPADIMIIGLAPGYEEIKLNKLFVGPSGQKLNSILQEVGLKRNQLYITNIVKCANTPGRKLSKTFIKKCSSLWLTKEIELVKPKVIIALGQDASSFFGKKFIVNSYFYNDNYNCWIVVTHHPARLLRTYDDKLHQELKMAFIIAKNLLRQSSSNILKSNAQYIENITIDILNKLGTLVAIDLETSGLNFLTDSIRAVGISNGNTTMGFPFNEQNKKVFQEWYKGKSFILHNAKFDYKFLKKEGIEIKVHFDTKLAHSIIDRDSPHGLSELALKYLHTKLTKGTIDFNDASYSSMDVKQLSIYAANDAFMTYKIYEILKPMIDAEYKFVYYNITIPTMLWLADAEFRGIKVDRDEIKRELAYMKFKLKSIESDINNHPVVKNYLAKKGLDKLNLRSPKQLSELLYEHLQLQSNDKNTSEATLEYLSEKYPQYTFIKQIVEYRHYFKGFRTYLENLLKFSEVDGRVHPDYSQTRTATYRLACHSPNLQNIPKSAEISKIIRKCFVATEEYVLLQADFSQAEFRCLGHYSRDYNLIRLINEKRDVHKMLASLAYNKPELEISDNERTIAKSITFGIMYGRGAKSIAEQFNIPVKEAQKIRSLFFEMFPEATKWMQKAKEFAKKYGFVKTLTGRKIPLPKVFSKDTEESAYGIRCAVNYPIQSAVADMTNLAGALIYHEFKKQKLDAYLLLNIHDALVIECHESIVDKVKELVIDIMKNRIKEILKLRVDLDVDVKIGKTLDLE